VAQPAFKIGFISSRQILQQTPGYAAAESTFQKEVQGFRDEVQKLQQQLDSAVRAFDQQSIALSPAAKQVKQRDLQQLQQRFEQRSNELQTRAQQRETELLQPIQAGVNAVIQGRRAGWSCGTHTWPCCPSSPCCTPSPPGNRACTRRRSSAARQPGESRWRSGPTPWWGARRASARTFASARGACSATGWRWGMT